MRIALYSDLHLECGQWTPPELDVDVVILAGDIDRRTRGLAWASTAFRRAPVSPLILYVAGNHEYYDAHLGMLEEMRQPRWAVAGVQFVERRTLELDGVRFLGCTLWSGFTLHGADKASDYMSFAKRGINDYWLIHAKGGKRLEPQDTFKLHRTAVRWLDAELGKPFDGKTVVVTHFAPHRGCVAPQHQNSDVSPYFVTDLAWLMEKYRIAVWCYGHTHTNTDFVAEGGCRVVSNQHGYPYENTAVGAGPTFNQSFVMEV